MTRIFLHIWSPHIPLRSRSIAQRKIFQGGKLRSHAKTARRSDIFWVYLSMPGMSSQTAQINTAKPSSVLRHHAEPKCVHYPLCTIVYHRHGNAGECPICAPHNARTSHSSACGIPSGGQGQRHLSSNRPHEMIRALPRVWRHPYTAYAAYPVRSLYSETASFSSRMPTTTAEPFLSMLT